MFAVKMIERTHTSIQGNVVFKFLIDWNWIHTSAISPLKYYVSISCQMTWPCYLVMLVYSMLRGSSVCCFHDRDTTKFI